jgi:hypothetical protein
VFSIPDFPSIWGLTDKITHHHDLNSADPDFKKSFQEIVVENGYFFE